MMTTKQESSNVLHPPPVSAPDNPPSTFKPWSTTKRKRALNMDRGKVKVTYQDREMASLSHMAALCRKYERR